MSLAATALKFWWLGLGLSAFAQLGCSSKLIRLGDEPAGASATDVLAGGGPGSGAAGGGGEMVMGPGDAGRAAGGGSGCPDTRVLANEVLWIGDSWIQDPGIQHSRVRDLARAAGAIGPSEDYADSAAAASTMAMITKQYEARQSGATKVKVLLMDGGTWEPIAAQMSGSSVPAAIDTAVRAFQQFLAEVGSDGTVEHIVYFLVPELSTIPGVATLRPQLEQACAASTVPCEFLDLQPLWAGHPEYTAANGIQASASGATVIAEAIWATMKENCIAQ